MTAEAETDRLGRTDETTARPETTMTTPFEPLVTWIAARLRLGGDRGASLLEYALLIVVIAVVCIAAVTLLGQAASDKVSSVGTGGR